MSATPVTRKSATRVGQPRTPAADGPWSKATRGDVRALVVDDQAVFRRAARAVIDAVPGFECVGEASSGVDGIELTDELAPDLVLMDVRMPGMDGVIATRQLVATHPGTMVILASLEMLADVRETTRQCGAAAFVLKQHLTTECLQSLWSGQRRPPAGNPS